MNRLEPHRAGQGLRIGIVVSRFNPEFGEGELVTCLETLRQQGVAEDAITVATVPGALEAPLTLQRMAQSEKFDALIALGAVIRGETYHFEIVSNESAAGISQVQLDFGIPIANGVLTTDSDEQARSRMAQKGRDCAQAVLEMVHLLRRLS